MSDYIDILKSAQEQGITMDSCGTDIRQKWWGLYNDLCGMSVEDALAVQYDHTNGGVTPAKEKNTITLVMQKSAEDYELVLNVAKAPTSTVTVSCVVDGESQTFVIPAGVTIYPTGIIKDKKYASIENISITTTDEVYKYEVQNNVLSGKFTLTYRLNDETYKTETVVCGTSVTVLDTPADYKMGYDFNWKDSDGNILAPGSTFTMPEKNVTIVGSAIIHQWTITYSYEGVEKTGGTKKVNYNTALNTIDIIKNTGITGYDFINWQLDGGGNLPTRMPDNDITIIATYQIHTWKIYFKIDGVVDTARTEEHAYGEAIDSSSWADPEKEGYTFVDWGSVPATMPDKNVTLTAKFSINSYTLTYIIEKEGEQITSSTVYKFGSVITWKQVSEIGFTFSGWVYEEGELPAKMPAKDISVTGELVRNSYNIKFISSGETIFEDNLPYESPIIKPADPEKEGYRFVKWDNAVPETMPAKNLVFNAVFEILQFTITYNVDGELYSAETHDYNSVISIINEPEKEGHTFSGWDKDLPARMPAYDIVVTGYFEINYYTVTYIISGETITEDIYQYNTKITPYEPEQITGYTFSGWYPELPENMPAHNLTVEGEYIVNQYTITYFVDDVEEHSDIYDYNEVIVPYTPAEREGYTFSGWDEDIPERMPANDIEARGYFNINSYTITYVISGETITADTYEFNAEIVPYEPEQITGYTFSGWNPEVPERMPAHDLTVEGEYIINVWELRFHIKDMADTAYTVEYNEELKNYYPEIDVPEGYRLTWDKDAPARMPDNDLIVNGVIEEIELSSLVYYGTALHSAIPSFTDKEIKALNNYNGDEIKESDFDAVIPKSEQYAEWSRLADLADDAGDTELFDYYMELMKEYRESHQFGALFIIPESLSLKDVVFKTGGYSVADRIVNIKTVEVDDTVYTIYEFTINGVKAWQQIGKDQSYNFGIIVE